MTTRRTAPDPRALPLAAWCRSGEPLAGTFALASLPRLTSSLAAVPDGDVEWHAEGRMHAPPGGRPEPWLELRARARVPLQCQRCLELLTAQLAVDRRIRFVEGEEQAARLDEESDDDVLALPARLDLRELIEDELILALPIVPRHEGACPAPLPGASPDLEPAGAADAAAAADRRPHAFAALADWMPARPRDPPES